MHVSGFIVQLPAKQAQRMLLRPTHVLWDARGTSYGVWLFPSAVPATDETLTLALTFLPAQTALLTGHVQLPERKVQVLHDPVTPECLVRQACRWQAVPPKLFFQTYPRPTRH